MKTKPFTTYSIPSVFTAMVATWAIGCGSSAANDLSREDAWQAAQTVNGSTESASNTGSSMASFAVQNFDVDNEVRCAEGGTMTLVGGMEADTNLDFGSPSFGATYYITVDAVFNGCTDNGITVDGDLSMVIDGGFNSSSGNLTASLVGTASFSGRINGSCDIDYSIDGDTDYSYTGSLCGYDAAELEADFEGSELGNDVGDAGDDFGDDDDDLGDDLGFPCNEFFCG